MAEKTPAPAFGPAPRPSHRVSVDVAERLAAETADLGFGRATSTPASETPRAPAPSVAVAQPAPSSKAKAAPRPASARRPVASARPAVTEVLSDATLKFEVPGELWTALKIEAAQRRVTVKFLVMEALSRQGYAVDLDAIPEDGRRLR